jgi:hypothetical protein
MLGAALVAGGLGLGATSAQAAQYGIGVREQVAYVPPCPGSGYIWVAGYYNDGYWVPGYWNFVGVARFGPVAHFVRVPVIVDRDRDRGRSFDRDRDHDSDHARSRR